MSIFTLFKKFHKIGKKDSPIKGSFHTDNLTKLKYLKTYIQPHIKQGVIGSVLLILGTLLSVPKPLFTKYIIDDVIVAGDLQLLHFVIVLLVLIILLELALSFFQNYLFLYFEQNVMVGLQNDLFSNIISAPKSFFDQYRIGSLFSRFYNDVTFLRVFFSRSTVHFITNIAKFCGGVVILVFLHLKLACISVLILPLFILVGRYFGQREKSLSQMSMEKNSHLFEEIQGCLSTIPLIKSFANEHNEKARIRSALQDLKNITVEKNVFSSFGNGATQLISSAGMIVVLWYGAYEIIQGRLTIGSLVAFNAYLAYLYGPSVSIINYLVRFQSGFAALDRISELQNVPSEYASTLNHESPRQMEGHVSFQNVCFSYNCHNPVLKNISFNARPGEKIAIVGHTGAGKTTLMNLLIKFYMPESGTIFIDGIPIEEFDLKWLRNKIGIVSQNILLFDGSIMDNISYGNEYATEQEVYDVCSRAQALEFIKSFSDGLHTQVGELGNNLSLGQKQRISIARSLLKNPDMFIFDEPTSALDPLTEKAVKNEILNSNATTFVISHRLSTVSVMDKILVLDKGEIIEAGTHDKLIELNGLYSEMYSSQFSEPEMRSQPNFFSWP